MYEPELKRRTISEVLGEDPSDYYLPTIQRDFVWDEDDIKEMIESILNGYPIGIITIFKTDIDFPSIPLVDSGNLVGEAKRYVLDGQQRLTSLLLIKNGWKITRAGEGIERTPIYFNPDNKTLRVKGKLSGGYDFSNLIKMCTFSQSPKQHLQKTLESLRKRFLDRPMAFYEVEVKKDGKSEEEIYKDMSEIFTRINRAGIRLGNLEMFLSFFASASVSKGEITKIHKEINAKYSMDLEPVIRFVFSNLNLSQHQITRTASFKKAVKDIKSQYSDAEINNVIESCRKCVENTMALLKNELGVSTTQILPSETALIPIFQYIFQRKIDNISELSTSERNQIIKWFLLSSFNGLYSSQTNTRVESDIKIIKSSQNEGTFPLLKLLQSMEDEIKVSKINEKDFVNVDINILRGTAGKKYLFLEYVLLCKNNATDWSGKLITEKPFNELDKHHIFLKDELGKVIDEEATINHIGNLTFIDKVANEQLRGRSPEDYLEDYDPDVLKKHFIPMDKNLWKMEHYDEFLKKRTELLWQGVENLMKELES